MGTKIYEPVGTEVQTLTIKYMVVHLKPGENAEELLDKIEALIKQFSETGKWTFKFDIAS
uniref:Uncharacterized protein n=1 Tax=viral metagenome TaxID=1070528 RepID=A0A6M3KTG6_9ZZZZ